MTLRRSAVPIPILELTFFRIDLLILWLPCSRKPIGRLSEMRLMEFLDDWQKLNPSRLHKMYLRCRY